MRIVSIAAVVLAITSSASAQQGGLPEVVVQRFVDAGNARNADAMAALVAPDATQAHNRVEPTVFASCGRMPAFGRRGSPGARWAARTG